MKARIEKKLSKRLAQIAPRIFRGAWIDDGEPSDLAYKQGSRVSHVLSVGGGTDWQGDGEDAFTAWAWWLMNWEWYGDFESYPADHQFAHYPNIEGFKRTTANLLRLAAMAEDKERKAKVKP